jgi:DNA modification methylase
VSVQAAAEPRSATAAATSPDAAWTVIQGDATEHLATLPEASVDAVMTDPPYGIGFQGHAWDQPGVTGRRYGRVTAHGRGHHRARAAASMVAGEYDQSPAAHLRYQEWCAEWASECLRALKPGGHLVSFGAPRTAHHLACGVEAAGLELRDTLMWLFGQGFPKSRNLTGAWAGWGTALKPAYEPILLARKPREGTTQENAEANGTGALHVDACRDGDGRWPPNLVLSHSPGCDADGCATDCPVGGLRPRARFFYCAKANRRERDAGCDTLDARTIDTFKIGAAARRKAEREPTRNFHPTVKPLALMRWLVRLVCAPGALVVDPFCGSGTTGCASVLEGCRFLGVERDADYAAIASARVAHWAAAREREGER